MLPPIFLSIYNLNGFVSPFWLISFFILYENFSELSSQCDIKSRTEMMQDFYFHMNWRMEFANF